METTETKSSIQTAAKETAESARKLGGKLRTLAGGAADSSRRWAKRCGQALSSGAQFTTLQANHRVLRTRLDRAHRELGRAVHTLHEKGGDSGPIIQASEVQAALLQVEKVAEELEAIGTKMAKLRRSEDRGDSAPS